MIVMQLREREGGRVLRRECGSWEMSVGGHLVGSESGGARK